MNNQKLAYKLRLLRAKKGLTIDELSAKSRVSRMPIINLENAKVKRIRFETILKLANALDVDVETLLKDLKGKGGRK